MLEALEAAVDGFVDDDVSLMGDSELRGSASLVRSSGPRRHSSARDPIRRRSVVNRGVGAMADRAAHE
jgi:hypothetical protein